MKRLSAEIDFKVQWYPFQLNPNASQEGVSKLEMYMKKFRSSEAQIMAMSQGMANNFQSVGLPFKFTKKGLTGNTFNGHRLTSYAFHVGGADMQDKVVEELFRSYFEDEQCPNSEQVLIATAVKAGIDEKTAKAFVQDKTMFADETLAELKLGRDMRVSGVPFFSLVNGANQQNSETVSGAQSPDHFVRVFRSLVQ